MRALLLVLALLPAFAPADTHTTVAAAAPAGELNACIAKNVAFDGITPLRFAGVSSEGNSRIYIHSHFPNKCGPSSRASCDRGPYVVPGDAVAIGKTCGGWAYVQYIGAERITYGWIAAGRLKEWHSTREEVDSASRTQDDLTPYRLKFRLLAGRGTPVCDAYLQRLNRTLFTRPAYCGRPENDSVPGFEWLQRIAVPTSEVNRLAGLDLAPPAKVASWRYELEIDVENNSHPENVLIFNLDDADDPRCGVAYYGINPTLDTGYQVALIMTGDNKSIDLARTTSVFGDATRKPSEVPTIQFGSKPFLPGFVGYGHSYSLFRYRGTTYFDTFLNDKPRRLPPLGDGNAILRVYRRQGNMTHVMCTIGNAS